MKFFLLAFLAVSVSAQQQCCTSQPQPVVIQLSCNNDNGYHQPMNPAPAPTPAEDYEEAPSEEHYNEEIEEDRYTLPMDQDRKFCDFEPIPSPGETTAWNVVGNGPLYKELPDPFAVSVDDGMLRAMVDTSLYQLPPSDWDGRDSTLGFPIPPKGSRHYNMLLCWPYQGTFQVEEGGMPAGP